MLQFHYKHKEITFFILPPEAPVSVCMNHQCEDRNHQGKTLGVALLSLIVLNEICHFCALISGYQGWDQVATVSGFAATWDCWCLTQSKVWLLIFRNPYLVLHSKEHFHFWESVKFVNVELKFFFEGLWCVTTWHSVDVIFLVMEMWPILSVCVCLECKVGPWIELRPWSQHKYHLDAGSWRGNIYLFSLIPQDHKNNIINLSVGPMNQHLRPCSQHKFHFDAARWRGNISRGIPDIMLWSILILKTN